MEATLEYCRIVFDLFDSRISASSVNISYILSDLIQYI